MSRPRTPALNRARRLVVVLPLLVGLMTSNAFAATPTRTPPPMPTSTPTPIKADPDLTEIVPSAYGPWFAWRQYSQTKPYRDSYYVQRGTRPRIRINAPGTAALSGSVLKKSVIYAQQRGGNEPRLYNFDLRTGTRSLMPPAVNAARYKRQPVTIIGDVSASGPLVLFTGVVPVANNGNPLEVVFLYDRVARKLKALDSVESDAFGIRAGQVNGSWATWADDALIGNFVATVHRLNLKTGREYEITINNGDDHLDAVELHDPAIGNDGTLYYWRYDETSGAQSTPHELVRKPVVGAARVIRAALNPPSDTFVQDQPDGTRAVYYGLGGDILKLVDNPT